MDFETARFNMIEQQVRPWNVLNQEILDLLAVVKREMFVPETMQSMAFTDMDLPINVDGKNSGQAMFAPKVEARFLQALAVKKHESVVEVGAGSGHMAALLASRAKKVSSFELNSAIAKFAQTNLKRGGFANVEVINADGSDDASCNTFSNVDVIVLSGSVEMIPQWLTDALAPNGRLIAIVGQSPVMTAELHTKNASGDFSIEKLFETDTPMLLGFPKKPVSVSSSVCNKYKQHNWQHSCRMKPEKNLRKTFRCSMCANLGRLPPQPFKVLQTSQWARSRRASMS